MSFGMGVGDIITLSGLAWKVYKSCKDAPDSFSNIATEVWSLHVVLKEAEETLFSQPLSENKHAQLRVVLGGCQGVLGDLEKLVEKYKSLGAQSKGTKDRMKWGAENIAELRTRLTSNTLLLTTQWISVTRNSIEKKLEEFLQEYRRGNRSKSVISANTMNSIISRQDDVWTQIREELNNVGITVEAFEENKQYIFDWLVHALGADAREIQDTAESDDLDSLDVLYSQTNSSMGADTELSSAPSHLFFTPDTASIRSEVSFTPPSLFLTPLTASSSLSSIESQIEPGDGLQETSPTQSPQCLRPTPAPVHNQRTTYSLLAALSLPNARLSLALRKDDLPAAVSILKNRSNVMWIKPKLFQRALECAIRKRREDAFRTMLAVGAHIVEAGRIDLTTTIGYSYPYQMETLLDFLAQSPVLLNNICDLRALMSIARQQARIDILVALLRPALDLGPSFVGSLLYKDPDTIDTELFEAFLKLMSGTKDEAMVEVGLFFAEQLRRDDVIAVFAEVHDDFRSPSCLRIILGFAIRTKDKGLTSTILERDVVDINAWGPLGRTMLQEAVFTGDISLVGLLLQHDGDVESCDRMNGWSVLTEAAHYGYKDVVDLLLKKGAEVNPNGYVGERSPVWQAIKLSHLELACFLIKQISGGNLDDGSLSLAVAKSYYSIVELLLNRGANPNFFIKGRGSPPLVHAALNGDHTIVELLLSKNAICGIRSSYHAPSPLLLAAQRGHLHIVKLLLKHGADVNSYTSQQLCDYELEAELSSFPTDAHFHCSRPLIIAAQAGHLDVVGTLLDAGARIASTCSGGKNALTYAIEEGHAKIVSILLRAGIVAKPYDIELASALGHVQIVKDLLQFSARLGHALPTACKHGKLDVARLLIEDGALPIDAYCDACSENSKQSKTALQWACEKGDIKIVRLLLQKGAQPDRLASGSSCGSPIELAAIYGFEQIVWLLLEKEVVVPDDLEDRVSRAGHFHIVKLLQSRKY